jgi:hypothetical protein
MCIRIHICRFARSMAKQLGAALTSATIGLRVV